VDGTGTSSLSQGSRSSSRLEPTDAFDGRWGFETAGPLSPNAFNHLLEHPIVDRLLRPGRPASAQLRDCGRGPPGIAAGAKRGPSACLAGGLEYLPSSVTRSIPDLAPMWWTSISGVPARGPPTRPSFARNSAMILLFEVVGVFMGRGGAGDAQAL
jgi:hypothetical protein